MKFKALFLTVALSTALSFLVSCGEDIDANSRTVDIKAFASGVTKGSTAGTEVPDPIGVDDGTIVLNGDFMYFSLQVKNNNDSALVITSIDAEVKDFNNNEAISNFSYAPQSYTHCSVYKPDLIASGRYFSFLNKDEEASIGTHKYSLFYIDQLKENEDFGGYRAQVTVTVRGFFTKASSDPIDLSVPCLDTGYNTPSEDPFLQNEAPFRQIEYFEVF